MPGTRRVVAGLLSLALVASTPQVIAPPLAGAVTLPEGAARQAPQQRSGTPDGLPGRVPVEQTAAKGGPGPAGSQRPPGAGPDRPPLPELRAERTGPERRTDLRVTPVPAAERGFTAASRELPEQRTATSTVFRNPDGSHTRRLHTDPVHLRQADGSWAPLDLTLRPGDRLRPRAASQDTSFAGSGADQRLASITLSQEHQIAFGLRGAGSAAPRVDGATATYPAVRPHTDVELAATAGGVKENLVLHSRAAPASFDFPLHLKGLRAELDGAQVLLKDGAGAVRALIPPGWMRDARGVESHDVRYRLDQDGGTQVLRVELDQAWLTAPERAYPVLADPSVQITAATDDTYLTKGRSANNSAAIDLRAGNQAGVGVHAAFLHFPDLVGNLRNQYVNGLALNLYNSDSGSCTPRPVDVYAVGGSWDGGQLRSWPGPPLAQHLAQRSFAHGKAGCAAARVDFDLNADLATDWTHGAPFHGLAVRAADERDTAAYKQFGSANGPANAKPFLDVTYAPQGADYKVEEVLLPFNNLDGSIAVTVRNRGAGRWSPGGAVKFGVQLVQNGQVKQDTRNISLPHDVPPGGSALVRAPLHKQPPGDYAVVLTMYDNGADFHTAHGVPRGQFGLQIKNIKPTSDKQQPGSGALVGSLRPTLYAEGIDPDNWPAKGLTYNYKICAGTPENPVDCVESGWTNATWAPPPGALKWSRDYYWWVQVHDTAEAGAWVGPLLLSTQVPQPQITAHLGGTPDSVAPGLDPQVGNFGLAGKDAEVATVGPDLVLTRTYNSLDPRPHNAFGEGWASRLDMELTADEDGSGNVVVTLGSGRQIRFGRNHDGGFAPPSGQNLTLVHDPVRGEYSLRDRTATRWTFNAWGRLRSITDGNGLTEELQYDQAGPTGKPHTLRNLVSGRTLSMTWVNGHVTTVSTAAPSAGAQPLSWTYEYQGDRLVKACAPGAAPNCTRYDYQGGSHYRSTVIDDSPRGFWRLSEKDASAGAANAVARKAGADKGGYTGVTLGAAGPLAGTGDTAAAFDGANSRIALPDKLASPTSTLAVELWFRTTRDGVLLNTSDRPFGSADVRASTPILYVGQDGHLRGGFWVPQPDGPRQVTSAAPVDDDKWHHVVLSGFVNSQTLYLDGVPQGTVTGLIDHDEQPHLTVGAGRGKGWPSAGEGEFHFSGFIDEVALYQHALGHTAIRQHHAAARRAELLTKITLPQDDRVQAQLTYDDAQDRVATLTDHGGRQWRLDTPARDEATRMVVLRGPYPDATYTYDADRGGRPVAETQDGGTRRYEYNAIGALAAVTDENNHRISFSTDDRGNVLSRTSCRSTSSCQTSYATYHAPLPDPLDPRNDRRTSDSDARSSGPADTTYRTSYGYDTLGRQIDAKYPAPAGSAAPTEKWVYSKGSEAAVGGGVVPAGLLVEHTGRRPGQVTRYGYRANGDLAEETSPLGLRTGYEQDLIGRRIQASTSFGATGYTYTPRSELATVTTPGVPNPLTGKTHTLQVRNSYDGNGNQTRRELLDLTGGDPPRATGYEYDPQDRPVKITFPDGSTETREYRDAGRQLVVRNAAGTLATTHLDHRARVLRRTVSGIGADPANPEANAVLTVEANAHDPAGRLALSRDAMGRETSYTYFDDGLPATATRRGVVQPDGSTRDVRLESREYDPAGNLTTLVGAGDVTTAAAYDRAGLPETVTFDPGKLKRVNTFRYDPDGQVSSRASTGPVAPGRVETTSYGYDADGNQLREEVALGSGGSLLTTVVRDPRGLVVAEADRARLVTDTTRDALGRPVTRTSPQVQAWTAGQPARQVRPETTMGYNAFGEVTGARDANGAVTTVAYDRMGRQEAVSLPGYTPPGGAPITATTRTGYDEVGNPKSVTDALDRVTTRTFDPYGRVRTETRPPVDGQPSTTTHFYNRNGELVGQADPAGGSTQASYDELGRQITATQVDRHPQLGYYVTKTGYDDAGNPVTSTSPAGHTSRTEFNAAGEPVKITDPTGRATTFGYDDLGRQAAHTDPAGLTRRTEHDLAGRPTRVSDHAGGKELRAGTAKFDPNGNLAETLSAEGRLRGTTYDALNRPVRQQERVRTDHTITTAFGYDPAGNRTRLTDGRGKVTEYTFTPWGLPESVLEPVTPAHPEPAQRTWTTGYDAAGQPVRETRPGNVVLTAEYDAQGRLRVQRGSGAEVATPDKKFGYDPAGRLSTQDTPAGPASYRYDDRGNQIESKGGSGEAGFSYDADSRLKSRVDSSGTAAFSYDGAGRLTSATVGLNGRAVDHSYDPAGRLAHTAERGMERFVRRVRGYDALGRLTGDRLTEFEPSGTSSLVLLGTEYDYDKDDNLTTKKTIDNGATTADTFGYDGARRLTSWTRQDGVRTGYEWDDAGNRTKAGNTTYTYDDRNRLLTDGTTTRTYTPRGTLAATTGPAGRGTKSDAFEQIRESGGLRYGYDSLGRIASRNGSTFRYATTDNDVVADGARLISRGPDGEPLADKAVDATGNGTLLYTDRHGDVTGSYRGLDVFGQRTFDPFGSVTTSRGAQPALGYQGEWTEPETGSVNMLTRWYEPGTSGFSSRDTWTLDPRPSVKANRYTYGDAAPLDNTDPSGHLVPVLVGGALVVSEAGSAIAALVGLGAAAAALLGGPTTKVSKAEHKIRPRTQRPVPTRPGAGGYVPPGPGVGVTPGPGGTPGPGTRTTPRPRVTPPPPPPPLWLLNLVRAPKPPKPGSTTTPRPPTNIPVDTTTEFIDPSNSLIAAATAVTAALGMEYLNDMLDGPPAGLKRGPDVDEDLVEDVRERAESCVDDVPTMAANTPRYLELDQANSGRAQGAFVCVETLWNKQNYPGVFKRHEPKPGHTPPGFDRELDHHRGHLVASEFHGEGIRKNLVPLVGTANTNQMRQNFEKCVADQVKQRERIFVASVPNYDGGNPVPESVSLVAVGHRGYTRAITVENRAYAPLGPGNNCK
ncbi:LamG-like jellyroll fold domain-containing protein [Crossiella sp. CA198]|uniref:LamG-like jellyroll fold domain-containing protein n=1 Tax=Crossiella sp. CA198 TaxID=3455607 RepID=UPI003F8D190B